MRRGSGTTPRCQAPRTIRTSAGACRQSRDRPARSREPPGTAPRRSERSDDVRPELAAVQEGDAQLLPWPRLLIRHRRLNAGSPMVDLLQVDHRCECVEFLEHVIRALILRELCHAPIRIRRVTERDRARRTPLRARRGELVGPKLAMFDRCARLRFANTLHAEAA